MPRRRYGCVLVRDADDDDDDTEGVKAQRRPMKRWRADEEEEEEKEEEEEAEEEEAEEDDDDGEEEEEDDDKEEEEEATVGDTVFVHLRGQKPGVARVVSFRNKQAEVEWFYWPDEVILCDGELRPDERSVAVFSSTHCDFVDRRCLVGPCTLVASLAALRDKTTQRLLAGFVGDQDFVHNLPIASLKNHMELRENKVLALQTYALFVRMQPFSEVCTHIGDTMLFATVCRQVLQSGVSQNFSYPVQQECLKVAFATYYVTLGRLSTALEAHRVPSNRVLVSPIASSPGTCAVCKLQRERAYSAALFYPTFTHVGRVCAERLIRISHVAFLMAAVVQNTVDADECARLLSVQLYGEKVTVSPSP
jgi:hypothetical protein